ncbi:alpha/beta fold hydrolase [Carnobacterium iners]|uniref:alpha/beta fold hydrolase n=1 Tax=Carnobacterium iners TaxID=1073423 RepID=UPI001F336760|nr:alpha/beta fold hydrolase [Carnobacterium iners]
MVLVSFIAILLSILVVGCGNKKRADSVNESQLISESKSSEITQEKIANSEKRDSSSTSQASIPTLFIHGYGGTDFTFNAMLTRFEAEDYGKQELTLTVEPDGGIFETGNWQSDSSNPFIQVLFVDNKNNEWNQADWIKAVLVYLKTTYQVDEVNLVGHSMGGVSSFRYLVAYGKEDTQPVVKRFVAMGAPFNDFVAGNENQTLEALHQNGPLVYSGRYTEFSAAIQQYPASTGMLNIAGDKTDGSKSDGTVSLSSSLSIGYLMQSNKFNYQEVIITGDQASHSQLHENKDVDERIAEFLQYDR